MLRQHTLRFTPYSYAKLLHLRSMSENEVGCFGIASDPTDLLLITNLHVPKQIVTPASVEIEADALHGMIEHYKGEGYEYTTEQFMRVWIHTHPSGSAKPSSVDNETFAEYLGNCPWSVQYILSKTDDEYCMAWFGIGPKGAVELPCEIAFLAHYHGVSPERLDIWSKEYADNVSVHEYPKQTPWPKPITQWKDGQKFQQDIPDQKWWEDMPYYDHNLYDDELRDDDRGWFCTHCLERINEDVAIELDACPKCGSDQIDWGIPS